MKAPSIFNILRLESAPWYALVIVTVAAVPFVLLLLLRPGSARARSSDWVEVSRGESLRAVRHVPTGRCFVRYSEGGLVETNADVCGPPR